MPNEQNENEIENGIENGLGKIVGDTLNHKPDVSEHVIENEISEQEQISTVSPEKPKSKETVDKYGRVFDPEYHQIDEHGNPAKNRSGLLKLKPGKPKPSGYADNPDINSKLGGVSSGQNSCQGENDYFSRKQVAKTATALWINTGCILYRQHGLPQEGEQETLEYAFDRYLEAKEIEDIPPGLGLTIALVDYHARRIVIPENTSRVKKIGKKIFRFGTKIFAKIRGRKYIENETEKDDSEKEK